MGFSATGITVTLYDTLESSSFALSGYVDKITNSNNIGEMNLLSDFIYGWVVDSEFFYMIKAFSTRAFKMPCFGFI